MSLRSDYRQMSLWTRLGQASFCRKVRATKPFDSYFPIQLLNRSFFRSSLDRTATVTFSSFHSKRAFDISRENLAPFVTDLSSFGFPPSKALSAKMALKLEVDGQVQEEVQNEVEHSDSQR